MTLVIAVHLSLTYGSTSGAGVPYYYKANATSAKPTFAL